LGFFDEGGVADEAVVLAADQTYSLEVW